MLSQLFFQRARQVKGRSHTGHTLVGNSDFFRMPINADSQANRRRQSHRRVASAESPPIWW